MKKNVFFFLFLFSSFFIHAQEIDVQWNSGEKMSKASASPGLLGINNGKVFILKSDNVKKADSYRISIHNEQGLEETETIDLEKVLPKDVADNYMEAAYLLDDRIAIITSTSKKELFGTLLELNGKILKGKVAIDRVDGKDKEFEGFEVELSPDRTKILGYRKTKTTNKKAIAYTFGIFNLDLKRIGGHKIEFPYEEDNFTLNQVEFLDNEDIIATAVIKIEGKRKKFDTQKAVIMHIPLSEKKPEVNEVNLPLEKRILSTILFSFVDNRIVLAGMYATNKDAEFMEGVFYMELERGSFNVISSSYEKFKPGLQTRAGTIKSKLENKVGFNYVLKNIYFDENGNKTLLFEYQYVTLTSDRNGTYKNNYVFDIIAVKLDANNKIKWNTMVYKYQYLRVPYSANLNIGLITISISVYKIHKKYEDMLSYTTLYKNGNLHLIFNDHLKNADKNAADAVFNNIKKSYTALVTIDGEKGKVTKKKIFNSKESARLMMPGNSYHINDNKILTFSYYKKTINAGYLTLE